jgi:iron complex outermembrane receptor protein
MKSYQIKTYIAVLLSLFQACAKAEDTEPFLSLALQEVLELEITSVSKKPQTVSRSAAAVFVITGDDIRRAGAQNIPDALRLAPGLHVAQISANSWAVSARGPNGRFANKLLVMIDGRTVYSPMFSGVAWDVQDTVLADIERIEVIRGPGASLWGANAVNGVINIITKSAAATQGTLVDVSAGTTTQGQVSIRRGGEWEGLGHWRLYGKAFENNALTLANGQGRAMDAWRQQRLGWRADLNPSAQDAVTLQSEIYQGKSGESALLNRYEPPSNLLQGTTQTVSGGHVLARWQRDLANNNSLTLQTYLDHSERDWPAHPFMRLDTLDADLQYRHRAIQGHDIVLGTAFRQNRETFHASTTGLPDGIVQYDTFDINALKTRMWSVMAQDDISLIPEYLTLTLGSKFEKYDNESLKPLPNARLMWTPDDNQTVWVSASKAIRTPSLIDSHGTIRALLPPEFTINGSGLPRPGFVEVLGRTTSEQLWAYELGWKQRLAPGLTLDTTAYYNDYSQLRAGSFNTNNARCLPFYNVPLPSGSPPFAECYLPVPLPNQYLLLPATLTNDFSGHSYGLEAWLDWQASRQHRWQANLTRYAMSLNATAANVYSWDSPDSSPKWTGSLRWSYTPDARTELDVMARHVGALRDVLFGQSVPSYTTLDMRWAWSSSPGVQWSVTGRNLMTSRHLEFVSEASDVARTLIGPSVIFGLRLQY